MFKWIHHILEPHCRECAEERESQRLCHSCETLKAQLEIANYDKKILLVRLMELTKPEAQTPQAPQVNFDEIKSRTVPWDVRRQMLEAEDRKKAQLLRDAAKREEENKKVAELSAELKKVSEVTIGNESRKQSIEELEAELGIGEGA